MRREQEEERSRRREILFVHPLLHPRRHCCGCCLWSLFMISLLLFHLQPLQESTGGGCVGISGNRT